MILHDRMTPQQAIFVLSNITLSDDWQGNQLATAAILKAIFALEYQAKHQHKKKRPKCPNKHNCNDCVFCEHQFDDSALKYKGFVCSIDAR